MDGYYEELIKSLKRRQAFNFIYSLIFSNKRKNSKIKLEKRSLKDKSSDDEDENDDEEDNDEILNKKSLFQSLCEIASNCLEQNDDTFDLSLGFLFGLVFVYLTLGAIASSRVANWSLFNGYYFSLISLTKIGLGDLVVEDTKFFLLSSLYTLFGLAFLDLTIQTLQEKIRLHLIKNAQNIVLEIIKFAKQFGYEWSIESINFNIGLKSKSFSVDSSAQSNTNANNIEQDEKEIILQSRLSSISPNSMSYRRIKKSIVDHHVRGGGLNALSFYDVPKTDKQTQITTLLYSKFKLEHSLNENKTITPVASVVASVKPNVAASKEDIKEAVIKEEKKFESTTVFTEKPREDKLKDEKSSKEEEKPKEDKSKEKTPKEEKINDPKQAEATDASKIKRNYRFTTSTSTTTPPTTPSSYSSNNSTLLKPRANRFS